MTTRTKIRNAIIVLLVGNLLAFLIGGYFATNEQLWPMIYPGTAITGGCLSYIFSVMRAAERDSKSSQQE